MKNFTNNFKQFTSRLSARWLIMALMMLVGTSSAWAVRVYYVNTNSWSKVNCYAWKDGGANEAGWPGTDITSKKCNFKVNGYDVYYYDTNDTSDKCIFNNGSSQSSDLTIANGPYFYGNTARSSVKDIYDNDAWMFYINQDYNTNALCIHNGSSYINGTYVASKNYYISTSKSNVNNKTINVTNNCGSWTGTGGKKGGTTVGTTYVHPGCYYKTGNQGTSIVKAATLSSLSIASSISKTDASSVNVTAKATSSTSSYGKALKAMYFVDNVYVTESAQLSTSGTTTTLDLSSFSDGSHTLSVILTDGTISYPDASTATFTIISCTPSATITEATYNCGETTIHLEGNLTEACGGMYFGWQYKTTSGDDWSTATAIAGHASNNYSTSAKTYELDWTIPSPGTTYYFRAYATPDAKTWYSDGTTKTVKTYKSPTLYTISGSDATLTLSDSEAGYTYTLYNNASQVSNSAKAGTGDALTWTLNDGGTYTVKAKPSESDCDEVLMNGSYTYSPCPAVATPTLSIVSEPKNNCGTETKGKIQITNYSSFSDCTFTLNGNACTPSSNGEIEVSESGIYNVVAINDCGSKSTAGSVTVSKTTITAPSTTPEVSLSYPQVAFATNDGSVNINLSIGERGITYYLYKDGDQVANSEKTGENKSLQWTVNESGTYTVKASNPCDGGYIAMTGSVKYTCMSNLELAFEGGKSVFCPGETTNIIVKFDGDGKGDEITNYGKYGWQWEKNNIDYTSVYLSESGVKVPVTIKGDGSIKLGVRSCGTIYSNELTFTVHKAPEAPTVSFSTNPVGQNKNTTLSIASYSADNTYVVYKSADDKVGDDTEVGTYTAPFAVSLAEVGNYYYYAVATSKACTDLVTTSTITKLEVLEAGAKIDALGATALFTNDPTHFIPMYVEKDGIVDVEGATKVTGYTWEFSKNGSSNWTACNYTYANFNAKNNKSEHKVVVTNGDKDCNNWRANAVGYYRCKMTYDNGASQYSNSIQVTTGTNSNTNKQHIGITYNLPIISVNTGDNDFPSDASLSGYPSAFADDLKKKRSVDVKIFNPDGTVCYDRKARMAYRGSSSLNFKKKSYAFCPGKAKCGDEEKSVDYVKTSKENLFGLSNGAEDKDWVLYAATPEPSMMRNRLTFDLYKEMRPQDWSVNSMYVELVINGEYKGVYVLMDKITQNKNRVKLSSADAFIVKFDKTDCVDRIGGYNGKVGDEKTFITSKSGKFGIPTYGTTVDQAFEIEYPEKEDFEEVNEGSWVPFTDKVKEKFVQFETALEKKDYTTVRSIIDYDSWADWFILTEFIKNQDGFRASNIFVYDGDKIEARPLWDQELSFKNKARIAHSCDNAGGLLVTTSSIYEDHFKAPFWFTGGNNSISGGLLSDPCFVSLVKQKWAEYSQEGGILTKTHIESKVSAYDSELGAAQSREAARWPYTGAVRGMTNNGKTIGYYGKNEGIEIGYADSKSDILSWAKDRVGGLTTALNGVEGEALIFTMTPSVEVTPWQAGLISIHAPEGYKYTVDFSEVEAVGGYVKNENTTYTVKLPRPADWTIGGNGSTSSATYNVTAKIEIDSEENTCGFESDENTKTSIITLKDEVEECDPPVTR